MIRIVTSVVTLLFTWLLVSGPALAKDGSAAGASALGADRSSIVLSRISTNPKKHYKHLKPMAEYLASHLAEFGITEGKVLFARDVEQMQRYIKHGKVDVISETVFAATMFSEQAGAEVALRRWKKGVAEYSSVLFSRKDSGIDSLEDLLGKTVAFQDEGSSSAYFIPASLLIRSGYPLYRLDNPRETPPKDAIGYVFAGKEINISAWVTKGIVDAGALSNINWNDDDDMPPAFREQNHVFYQSPAFPRGVEMLRSDMTVQLKARIRQVLLDAHHDEAGQQALRAYQKTRQFDEVPQLHDSVALASELIHIVDTQL